MEAAAPMIATIGGQALGSALGNAFGGGPGQQGFMEAPVIDPEQIKRQRAQADAINAMLTNPNSTFAGQNTNLMNLMQQQALGQGPSAAQQMMTNGMNTNANNNLAMAASQRGVNPMMANRMAMQQNNLMNQQTMAAMAAQRAQEQQQAMGQLGQYENQLRGIQQGYEQLGLGAAQANLGAQNDTNKFNMGIGMNNANNRKEFQAGITNGLGGSMGMFGGSGGGSKSPVTTAGGNYSNFFNVV